MSQETPPTLRDRVEQEARAIEDQLGRFRRRRIARYRAQRWLRESRYAAANDRADQAAEYVRRAAAWTRASRRDLDGSSL